MTFLFISQILVNSCRLKNPAIMSPPVTVCVSGAAGQIAYSLLYSIAKGDVFGTVRKASKISFVF